MAARPEHAGWFSGLHAAPEDALNLQQDGLVDGIRLDFDQDPLGPAGQDREVGPAGSGHEHVVLELRHVLLGGALVREVPRQHELRLEDSRLLGHHPVESGSHPVDLWVADEALDLSELTPGLALEPMAIEVLGRAPELNE